jgi:hypothetical protein
VGTAYIHGSYVMAMWIVGTRVTKETVEMAHVVQISNAKQEEMNLETFVSLQSTGVIKCQTVLTTAMKKDALIPVHQDKWPVTTLALYQDQATVTMYQNGAMVKLSVMMAVMRQCAKSRVQIHSSDV